MGRRLAGWRESTGGVVSMDLAQIDFERLTVIGLLGLVITSLVKGWLVAGWTYREKCAHADKAVEMAREAMKLSERLTQGWLPPARGRR